MLQATKVRIYPNKNQKAKLDIQFGCARWVWNKALDMRKAAYKEDGSFIKRTVLQVWVKEAKKQPETDWLKEADSQVLQYSLWNLDRAYEGFFKKKAGFPKFKSRKAPWQSIQYPQRVKVDGNKIYLPKVGWVKAVVHREIDGKIKTVTVKKAPTGKYYASILTDNGQETPEQVTHFDTIKGVDLGIETYYADSNGHLAANPRFIKTAEVNQRRKQRKLSRKTKGSKNRNKARLLVAKAHERVKNARMDFHHKLSHQLACENQAVVIEDLAVKNMMQNRRLAKHIADVAWAQFTRMIGYKLMRKGGRLVVIDRWYPSSKTCSECGHVMDSMPLRVRSWQCPECKSHHHRDINAAVNIKNQGVLILKADGCTVSACGGSRKTFNLKAAA